MTLRQRILERIEDLDEDALVDVARDLDALERRRAADFPADFLKTMLELDKANADVSPEEADEIAAEAVRWARQSRI